MTTTLKNMKKRLQHCEKELQKFGRISVLCEDHLLKQYVSLSTEIGVLRFVINASEWKEKNETK